MRPARVLGEGFRVFFLAAGLFAVFSMAVWDVWFAMEVAGRSVGDGFVAPPPHLWHAHEMIYGYAAAVLAGFFLTAVPNWSGGGAADRRIVGLLAAIWLAGRAALWWSANLSPGLVMALDLAFLPGVIAWGLVRLARKPKPQNLMLVGLVTLVWFGNLRMHLDWVGITPGSAEVGARIGLLALAAMVTVIGGRVTPAFTRNAMRQAGIDRNLPRSRIAVEIVAIVSAILLPVLVALHAPDAAVGAAAACAGMAQALRLTGWRGVWTLDQPILWSLHLGAAMLALGYLALALATFGTGGGVAALHILGIGAVGGMTLAVMSRAALGHSGRPLVAPNAVTVAYLLVAGAALMRAFAPLADRRVYTVAILGSGALWCIAFALFVVAYWQPLTGPRLE